MTNCYVLTYFIELILYTTRAKLNCNPLKINIYEATLTTLNGENSERRIISSPSGVVSSICPYLVKKYI